MNDIFIFTDCDLDGAGSYLMFEWFIKKNIPYKIIRVNDFKQIFAPWYEENGSKYKQIYILDLDVSQESQELVDKKNVTIIDHHKTHANNKDNYKNATTIIKEYSSCTKLIYNLFTKKTNKKLSAEQKMMVLHIDDYDSYELKLPQSYDINIVYWNYQGDRISHFLNDFGNGFNGFSAKNASAIKFYKNKFKSIINRLDVHHAPKVPIGKNTYKFVSVFAESHINEIADHIIKNYKADVGFVVNLKTNKVSIRKSKECELDLGAFSSKLFDAGGGHEYAAGGLINEKFLQLSKLFSPARIKIGS